MADARLSCALPEKNSTISDDSGDSNVIMSSQEDYDPPFVSLRRLMADQEGKESNAPPGAGETTETSPKDLSGNPIANFHRNLL